VIILVTSDEPWSDVWHTQIHYAYQLSKYYEVIYMDPPAPWSFTNMFRINFRVKKPFTGISVIRYHNLLPAGFGKLALFINDKLNAWRIRKVTGNLKSTAVIVWHFDPFRSYYVNFGSAQKRTIYHVVDPFTDKSLDAPLAKRADLVVVTSPKFVGHYHALNPKTMLIKQGLDNEFYKHLFNTASADSFFNDKILFLGTLSNDVDFELFERLAEVEHLKTLFIGPRKFTDPAREAKFDDLIKRGDVDWIGPMPPEKFIPLAARCKVGVIAYDKEFNANNNFRSPLKAITYLAAKLPVVSNIDCEIPELKSVAIYEVNGHQEFVEAVKRGAEGKLLFDTGKVNAYLNTIDYHSYLQLIFERLEIKLPGRRG
jgi:hypothetical protein